MANIELLTPLILKWEGGEVNDSLDRGGHTNMGVTISTWKAVGYDKDGDSDIDGNDLHLMNKKDFNLVLRKYWDRWQADNIINQSIANLLVDMVWGSGKWGIIKPQQVLGVVADGMVGKKTIDAVNSANQKELFDKLFKMRVDFLNNIVKNNPSQKRFIKGWMNRLNDFKFQS